MILPPPAFDHPYAGPLTEYAMSLAETGRFCRASGAKDQGVIYGCQVKHGTWCVIAYADDVAFSGIIRRFEIAHCNEMPKAGCRLCRWLRNNAAAGGAT